MSAIIEHFAAFMAGALVGITATALWALARRPDTQQTPESGRDEWACAVAPANKTEIYLGEPDSDEGLHNYHTLDQARQMRAQLDAVIAQIEQNLPDRVEFDEATGRVTVSKGGAA